MILSIIAPIRQSARILCALPLFLVAQNCVSAQSISKTPIEMIKQSMTRYAQLTTFHADCIWTTIYDGHPTVSTPNSNLSTTNRALWYQKPNLFKVVNSFVISNMVQTSVSDGTTMVEFATGIDLPAISYAAPASIADAASMQMGHPMFCGSLLYKFFGGPDRYSALVDEAKMPVTFGTPVTLEGQECKTVAFWAQGPMYGKTEIAIGTTDGLIHRIRYGSEPLMQTLHSGTAQAQLKKVLQSPEFEKQLKKANKGADTKVLLDSLADTTKAPTTSLTTESYVHIEIGKPIAATVFSTKVPAGRQIQAMGGGSVPQPPVALGAPAPDIRVVDIDGVKHRLTDFKGKVVLIDFWATWCPPCRKGLPETQGFYTQYGTKGLAVLTISDEEKAAVLPFIKQNKYTFPVYLDAGGATNTAYHITAIPTVVVIDTSGNLVAYMVGLSPHEDILAALKKAGLVIP